MNPKDLIVKPNRNVSYREVSERFEEHLYRERLLPERLAGGMEHISWYVYFPPEVLKWRLQQVSVIDLLGMRPRPLKGSDEFDISAVGFLSRRDGGELSCHYHKSPSGDYIAILPDGRFVWLADALYEAFIGPVPMEGHVRLIGEYFTTPRVDNLMLCFESEVDRDNQYI